MSGATPECAWRVGITSGAARSPARAAVVAASIKTAGGDSFTADPALLLGRAATSTLAHACFSACAGFLAGLAKLRGGRAAVPLFLAGLALATLLHGSYDALLLARPGLDLAALLLVLPASLVLTSLALRWSRARSPQYHPRG
jgi:RsiW-degrading membrane proteinase PrsW (M82 family)